MRHRLRHLTWSVSGVMLLLGTLLGINVRINEAQGRSVAAQRLSAMQGLLQTAHSRQLTLKAERKHLAQSLAKTPVVSKGRLATLRSDWWRAAAMAGFTPVSGPGIRLVVSDSTRPLLPGESPEVFLLHDSDLLRIVASLLDSGAQAVSINGQRIGPLTQIRCAGPTISVGQVRTTVPVTVLAVGPSPSMIRSLWAPTGILPALAQVGMPIQLTPEVVTVPALPHTPSHP